MRNLDETNPKEMRPSRFVGVCAGLPFVLGSISLPLAYGAAPEVPLLKNPVAQVLFAVLVISLFLAVTSLILRWDWKVKYYGVSLLFGASISLFAVVPLLVLMIYGSTPLWLKIVVLFFYVLSHALWCRKFFILYGDAFNNTALRKIIYEEDSEAVYYLRRGDQFLLDRYYKFSQMPRDRYFVVFIVLALGLMPMIDSIRTYTGIPFTHVFLLVAMLPVSWMSFGFAIRGYLVCYLFPTRIKIATGKEVYVDVFGSPPSLDKIFLRAGRVKKIKR